MLLTLFLGGRNDSVVVFGDDDLFFQMVLGGEILGGAVFGDMFSTFTVTRKPGAGALFIVTVPKKRRRQSDL